MPIKLTPVKVCYVRGRFAVDVSEGDTSSVHLEGSPTIMSNRAGIEAHLTEVRSNLRSRLDSRRYKGMLQRSRERFKQLTSAKATS